jgi:hypothetical protein
MMMHQRIIHGTRSRVHLEFCVEAINRIGGNNYCFLAAALVQTVLLLMQCMSNCTLREDHFIFDLMNASGGSIMYSI